MCLKGIGCTLDGACNCTLRVFSGTSCDDSDPPKVGPESGGMGKGARLDQPCEIKLEPYFCTAADTSCGVRHTSQLMRLWYLSHRRPAKAQANLRIRAVSPEPSLFANIKFDRRQRVRLKSDI